MKIAASDGRIARRKQHDFERAVRTLGVGIVEQSHVVGIVRHDAFVPFGALGKRDTVGFAGARARGRFSRAIGRKVAERIRVTIGVFDSNLANPSALRKRGFGSVGRVGKRTGLLFRNARSFAREFDELVLGGVGDRRRLSFVGIQGFDGVPEFVQIFFGRIELGTRFGGHGAL